MIPYCAPTEERKYRLFDCNKCQSPEAGREYADVTTRRVWHCGWMDREEWIGDHPDVPTSFGDEPYKEDICPGYLMAQPLVSECVEAWRAMKTGNWGDALPDAAYALWDGAVAFDAEVEAYQSWVMRQAREKSDRQR